eukprot:GHVU01214548.1.p1 GENE.GHVU01214548.1~~GHVU01214548.1.p1  ORF type:complete len:418 (+),score=23.47 GHVU01214548.1:135-1388(+)
MPEEEEATAAPPEERTDRKKRRRDPPPHSASTGSMSYSDVLNKTDLNKLDLLNSSFCPYFGVFTTMIFYFFNTAVSNRKMSFLMKVSNPYITGYWYTIIAYWHILRCMNVVGGVPLWVIRDLQFFEANFNPETTMIPGYLKPFFESLSISSDIYGRLVYPRMPEFPGTGPGGILNTEVAYRFPCVHAMLRAAHHMHNRRPARTNLFDPASINAPDAVQLGTPLHRDRFVLPGLSHDFVYDQATEQDIASVLRPWQNRPLELAIPPAEFHPGSWREYLYLNENLNFFRLISSNGDRLLPLSNGNFSLASLSLKNGASGLVRTRIFSPAAPLNALNQVIFRGTAFSHLEVVGTSLEAPMMTFINATLPGFLSGGDADDESLAMEAGPTWTLPTMYESREYNVSHMLERFVLSTMNIQDH